MAEGFARLYAPKAMDIWSAGSRPGGTVDATAIQVMREKQIDLTSHRSKGLNELPGQRWDYVVSMGCGEACPTVDAAHRLEWNIPDPKGLPMERTREIRDNIEQQIKEFLSIFLPKGERLGR
ncbi:MAG: arsenate reductase ArsC [Candidatus Omnitrophica bacterium]|nr:arsenate reductase ArsC [Candidatus Omnitrophota bacterium]